MRQPRANLYVVSNTFARNPASSPSNPPPAFCWKSSLMCASHPTRGRMLFAGELHSHEYSLGPDPLGPLKGRGIPTCAAISATQTDKPQFVLCGLCLPTALFGWSPLSSCARARWRTFYPCRFTDTYAQPLCRPPWDVYDMSHSIRTFLLERVDIEAPTATYLSADWPLLRVRGWFTRQSIQDRVEAFMVTCTEGTPDRNADVLSN